MSKQAGQPGLDIVEPARRGRGAWTRGRALRWTAAGLAVLCTAGLARVAPFVFEPNRFGNVRSIEADASFRDPKLMAAAAAMPVASRFRRFPYEFQDNPSFCGPASLADVLHSLGDGRRQHQIVAGTPYDSWFGVLLGGLTLDQVADLAGRTVGPTTVLRDDDLARFRAHLREVNSPAVRYVVNFHRGPLFGRGHGHFSPLLAYLPDRDLVLVGDVNAAYRPFLVPAARLWAATRVEDGVTGKPRGLLRIDVRGRRAG